MSKMDGNIVCLIMEIEKRPPLWDISLQSAQNDIKLKACWEEITNIFGGFSLTSVNERNDLCLFLKRKWRKLRRTFHQERRYREGTHPKPFKTPYKYYDLLLFLNKNKLHIQNPDQLPHVEMKMCNYLFDTKDWTDNNNEQVATRTATGFTIPFEDISQIQMYKSPGKKAISDRTITLNQHVSSARTSVSKSRVIKLSEKGTRRRKTTFANANSIINFPVPTVTVGRHEPIVFESLENKTNLQLGPVAKATQTSMSISSELINKKETSHVTRKITAIVKKTVEAPRVIKSTELTNLPKPTNYKRIADTKTTALVSNDPKKLCSAKNAINAPVIVKSPQLTNNFNSVEQVLKTKTTKSIDSNNEKEIGPVHNTVNKASPMVKSTEFTNLLESCVKHTAETQQTKSVSSNIEKEIPLAEQIVRMHSVLTLKDQHKPYLQKETNRNTRPDKPAPRLKQISPKRGTESLNSNLETRNSHAEIDFTKCIVPIESIHSVISLKQITAKKILEIIKIPETITQQQTVDPCPNQFIATCLKTKESECRMLEQVIATLKQSIDERNKTELKLMELAEDEDKLFVFSLINKLKRVPDNMKLTAKRKIMQVLEETHQSAEQKIRKRRKLRYCAQSNQTHCGVNIYSCQSCLNAAGRSASYESNNNMSTKEQIQYYDNEEFTNDVL